MNGKRFIVGGGIPIVLTPFKHEEDRTQELVRQSDDSAFMATTHDQGLEFRLEDRPGTAGGMSEFAQQATDMGVAFTKTSGFVLARRFIIAGTDAHPGRQTTRTTEGIHVGANLHQQHGGPNEIDTGQGLQQGQRILLARQPLEQSCIEARDARFDFLDVLHQFIEDEAMAAGEFGLAARRTILHGWP